MTDIPAYEPTELRAGDTWAWTRSLPDYPAGVWTLKYRFKSAAGGFEITALANGTDHLAGVTAAASAGYAAGEYTWIAWVESGVKKFTVAQGAATVLPDYRAGEATVALDDRSHARKMLDKINAWLETRDPAVAEYEIAGRKMKYIPITELIKLQDRYRNELARENNAARLAAGLGGKNKLLVRFGSN